MRAASGAADDPVAAGHLQSCAECRAAVAEWRATLLEFAALRGVPETDVHSMCPDAADLAAFCAGRRNDSEEILEHIAGCRRCGAIAAAAMDDAPEPPAPLLLSSSPGWRRIMAERFSAVLPAPRRFTRFLPVAAALLLVAAGAFWWAARNRQAPAQLLARAYTATRPFEYWMPDNGYSAVRQQRGPASHIDRPAPLVDAEIAARKLAAAHPDDPRALEFKGRVQLLELDYDAAIESLTRAREEMPRDAGLVGALATAYAARGSPPDLMQALDLYLQAQQLDPKDVRIRFNLGLVYEKQSMVPEALAAFESVLGSAIPDPWRREAESHRKALLEKKHAKEKADAAILGDPAPFIARYGAGAPFDCLEYVDIFWSEWLPRSDVALTRRAAELVADRMAAQFGDPSLRSTLAQVAGRRSWRAIGMLAASIRQNRSGRAQETLRTAVDAAVALDLERLEAAADRARVELAYALRWAGKDAECLAVTEHVERRTPRNQLWLRNQARLEHSSCAAGVGRFDEARAEIQSSRDETSAAGLWPVALRASGFLTAIDGYTGNYAAVWDPAFQGLSTYWTSSASIYRAQNFEFDLYKAARLAGWRSAALVFYRAVMECSRTAGNREMEAWDRFGIAGLLHENGELQAEFQELQAARRLVGAMDGQSAVVDNLRWEALLRQAEAQAAASPADALRNLRGLEENTAHRTLAQQMRLWQARGLALVAASDVPGAAAAFQKGIALNRQEAASVRSWVDRMPVLDLAAPSYRGLTQIQLQTISDPAAALETWRLYRGEAGCARGLTITMALLPRGIAVWRSGAGSTTVRWVPDAEEAVLRWSERLRRLCSSSSSEESQIRKVGARIYRALLGPELQSAPPGLIRINADSWLAAIPLSALTDESGAYLARKWSFVESYGPAARAAATAIEEPIVRTSRALIVVSPSARIPGGGRTAVLAAALPEARDIAGHFSAEILKESPSSGRLGDLHAGVELFHFVGHGWANGGGGALLMGSPEDGSSFVTARELASLDWSKCRLAVLSACLTATGAERGMVNNQSLVQALLGGGAHRVVAARWSIDSEATRSLMDGFYQALMGGAPAPAALALAANAVASKPSWSHPYYWAAFDVFGSS